MSYKIFLSIVCRRAKTLTLRMGIVLWDRARDSSSDDPATTNSVKFLKSSTSPIPNHCVLQLLLQSLQCISTLLRCCWCFLGVYWGSLVRLILRRRQRVQGIFLKLQGLMLLFHCAQLYSFPLPIPYPFIPYLICLFP